MLSGVSGLVIHAQQVHKITITEVPNAVPGRTDPSVDVFGMQGVPAEAFSGSKRKRPSPPPKPDSAVESQPGSVYLAQDAPPPVIHPLQNPLQQTQQVIHPQYQYMQPYQGGNVLQYNPPYVPPLQPLQHGVYRHGYHQPYGFGSNTGPPSVAHGLPPLAAPAWARRTVVPPLENRPFQSRAVTKPASFTPAQTASQANGAAPTISTEAFTDGAPSVPGRSPKCGATPSLPPKTTISPSVYTPYETTAASTASGAPVLATATSKPGTTAAPKMSVVNVFDRDDVCMEELRAQLPRYTRRLLDTPQDPKAL
jgi:hypothetical protein